MKRLDRCRLAVLVLLYTRRHAMLAGEIAAGLKSTYTHDEVQAAILYLHDASSVYDAPHTIRWSTQGWIIADAGICQVQEALAMRTRPGRVHRHMTPRREHSACLPWCENCQSYHAAHVACVTA